MIKGVPQRPRSWDAAVSAAYLRLLGHSQAAAADAAGVGERTLRGWERAQWWPRAIAEAEARWLDGLTAAARCTLLRAVRDGDAERALRILERVMPELAPPRMRVDLSTLDYGAMSDDALVRIAAGEFPARVLADERSS